MEITINLRISADASLTSLLQGLSGGAPSSIPKVVPIAETKKTTAKVADVPSGESKVTVEELREVASALMIKNKAALKEILVKYDAKTVAALDESNYEAAFADMKKASK